MTVTYSNEGSKKARTEFPSRTCSITASIGCCLYLSRRERGLSMFHLMSKDHPLNNCFSRTLTANMALPVSRPAAFLLAFRLVLKTRQLLDVLTKSRKFTRPPFREYRNWTYSICFPGLTSSHPSFVQDSTMFSESSTPKSSQYINGWIWAIEE